MAEVVKLKETISSLESQTHGRQIQRTVQIDDSRIGEVMERLEKLKWRNTSIQEENGKLKGRLVKAEAEAKSAKNEKYRTASLEAKVAALTKRVKEFEEEKKRDVEDASHKNNNDINKNDNVFKSSGETGFDVISRVESNNNDPIGIAPSTSGELSWSGRSFGGKSKAKLKPPVPPRSRITGSSPLRGLMRGSKRSQESGTNGAQETGSKRSQESSGKRSSDSPLRSFVPSSPLRNSRNRLNQESPGRRRFGWSKRKESDDVSSTKDAESVTPQLSETTKTQR